jgi:putative tryptophan/tyrosine transport system substrate-binding protein
MAISVRRRELFLALGGVAAAWPLAARAQQADRMRRIGVLMLFDESDVHGRASFLGFAEEFEKLGWIDGRNVRMEVRWAAGDVGRIQTFVKELVDMRPDVILSHGTPITSAFHRTTRSIPVVFVGPADPVGDGFIESLSRPGGNFTGFLFTEAEIAGKFLELLVEIAPHVKKVAIIFNRDTAPGHGSFYLPSFESAARNLKLELIVAPVRGDVEIEAVVSSLGRERDSGLIAMPDPFLLAHRASIISSAARSNVPEVGFNAVFPRDGGLLSYGPDHVDLFRRGASYVDRILRGAKPAELPTQAPIKFEMVLNVGTAKALGLVVPANLLALADEVIE